MRSFTNVIDIDAPAHDVFVALRSVDGYAAWLRHSMVYRGTRTPAHPADASPPTYEDSTMIGRMRGELLEERRDRELRFHQAKRSGRVDALIVYRVANSGDRTTVTRVGELTTHGIYRMVEPVFVRMASTESARTMRALKAHVEREVPSKGA
ncbi:SRPBCC family protein [uncultured Leifsonia sp.]|uniref:SRPBCC family protein n=1 Tax=uncultured Leifsonia sp. TaxID=340359 RepID=UPI0025D8F2E3|nr:SRPBCC family protein [uncultured Leifsonia sp.]